MVDRKQAAADRERRNSHAVIAAAVQAGRAIKAGALLRSLRLPDPEAPDEGIIVHLDDAEAAALTARLAELLAARLAV